MGATTIMFNGAQLMLPLYDPNNKERTEAAQGGERAQVADGIVLGSPGYHRSISGLIKNALDYTEDLREDRKCTVVASDRLPCGMAGGKLHLDHDPVHRSCASRLAVATRRHHQQCRAGVRRGWQLRR